MRLLKPREQALAILDPVQTRIDRRGDGIEEIEAKAIGNKYGGR
ncbi:hypothetical protein [Rhodanobacter koreensis]